MSQSSRADKRVSVEAIVIIVVVIAVLFIIGPNVLPNFISRVSPAFYSGTPCSNLRRADNRAFHQSLLGRGATSPIRLDIATSALPTTADGFLNIYITVFNESYGTVPIVFDPNQVTIGDNGSSGLGLLFNPPNSLTDGFRQNAGSVPDSGLRLLAPRQRCVHEVQIPAGNVFIDPGVSSGTAQVRAFYRNSASGTIIPPTGVAATPIFNDQGLWVGYVESPSVVIPQAASAAP